MTRGRKINYISEAQSGYGTFSYRVTEDGIVHMAYCVNSDLSPRSTDSECVAEELPMTESKNQNLFKVLYYGFDGEGDLTASYFGDGDRKQYLFTHIAAGIVFNDNDPYKGISADMAQNYNIQTFVNEVTQMPLPTNAKLMLIPQHTNEDGVVEQGIAYILTTQNEEMTGGLQITKKGSVLTKYVDGKFVWEDGGIPGVEFELIAGEDLLYEGVVRYTSGSKITVDLDGENLNLKTNKKGKITVDNIPLGKYKIKEKDAPDGYMTSAEVKQGTITTAKPLLKFSVYDERQKIKLILQKIDAKSEEKISGGNFN